MPGPINLIFQGLLTEPLSRFGKNVVRARAQDHYINFPIHDQPPSCNVQPDPIQKDIFRGNCGAS